MAQLNKFQMIGFNHWKGLTKENHLGSFFQSRPQEASKLWVQLLALYRGKTLDTYISKFPVKEFDTDDDYTWHVIGSSRRNIPLVEARTEAGVPVASGGSNVGVNGAPFFVVFPEDWFADGNVIVGEKNESYPLRILGEARIEGTNAVYKVELMGGVTTGMPAAELLAGKRFSVEYSPVERELSRQVGDIRFSTPTAMRNEFSTLRIKHKVPGSMLEKKLAVGIPFLDASGKQVVHNMWMHHVDYVFETTFAEEKNNLLMYGRSNRNKNGEYLNFGKSGNVIKMGAGLREQMEVANTMYYNTFSLKLIEDALYELSASKLEFGDRTFILRTGERGAAQFSKAVKQEISGWTQFDISASDLGMIQKTSSPFHQTSLAAGYQFTEWRAPMGVTVKVEVDPLYDDPVRNKIQHPLGGVAESYRYDILYIGTMDQPNIQLARIKGPMGDDIKGYQWGLRNPFTGSTNNPYMSYDEDSAIIHKMWTGGVFILDPTRTMSIIPAILQ